MHPPPKKKKNLIFMWIKRHGIVQYPSMHPWILIPYGFSLSYPSKNKKWKKLRRNSTPHQNISMLENTFITYL
jgi:hypothetical protein